MIRRTLELEPFCTCFLLLTEAGGDPAIFCYLMGVGILSAGGAMFLAPAQSPAPVAPWSLPEPKRNQVACSNLFSTFSALFSTPRD